MAITSSATRCSRAPSTRPADVPPEPQACTTASKLSGSPPAAVSVELCTHLDHRLAIAERTQAIAAALWDHVRALTALAQLARCLRHELVALGVLGVVDVPQLRAAEPIQQQVAFARRGRGC